MSELPPDPTQGGELAPGSSPPLNRFFHALALSREAFRRPLRPVDWLVPLLIVLLVSVAGAYLLKDLTLAHWEQQSVEQIESNERMTPEQREEALEGLRGGQVRTMVGVSTILGHLIAIPIACLLAAGALTLIISFALGGSVRFGEMWFVACLAWGPHAVRTVLMTALARASGNVAIHFGPAALVSDEQSTLASVLAVFDLFDLWMLGIHVVGVGALTALTKGKARTAVLIMWICYWVIAMAFVLIGRRLQGLG
jgi:hypothetical protein